MCLETVSFLMLLWDYIKSFSSFLWEAKGEVFGAIIAIGTAIGVEFLRRPNLKLLIIEPTDNTIKSDDDPRINVRIRSLCIRLLNKPITWMMRDPALQCRATITFYYCSGEKVFREAMEGRWSNSLEPIPVTVVAPDGQRLKIYDPQRLTLVSRIDVHPGESEDLDIVARHYDKSECYGWNNERYFSAPKWNLKAGRYLVKVLVSSSGRKCCDVFRLMNDGLISDFRLEMATPDEKKLVID
jgi:hypothetical protein